MQFDEYGGIDVLQVRDVPRPAPAAGEVLVKVRAAGINPR
ncbi:Zn-dependent oxidoreductase, NADPH:quinone reductase [Mycobacterium senegalense]|uniref:Zn-dependent oxidoreductase, NADPH:quinone reductase n=1 Tax=Mycolicibacterium senegalense TaxID=1796 RepID=A0A378T0R0_9MYCO|nr:NADPH:quinone reductase-like Zn-dependent oxidoreductase [Mycolicibacterium senegalense]STZ54379.1 Zn-dependent oxidoreductase, NADPH:quinone reductase [Mycolicibacterium senegalense]